MFPFPDFAFFARLNNLAQLYAMAAVPFAHAVESVVPSQAMQNDVTIRMRLLYAHIHIHALFAILCKKTAAAAVYLRKRGFLARMFCYVLLAQSMRARIACVQK